MSGAERARRFRERRKADAARNFSTAANLASTSTTGIPVLMDVTNEQTIDISIGSATELRDLNISRSEAMQNHWRSADKRFKTVFEANLFGLSCSVCDRLWFERDLKKVKHRNIYFLQTKFPDENVTELRLCSTCSKSIDANKIPTLFVDRLPTLSMQTRAFCKRDVLAERNEDQGGYLHRRRQLILIVSAFNAQSLVAHAGDIESDNILMNSDYMVISETWMNCANTVMINGFELRASNNTALGHRTHCPSTSSELPVRVSAAGGSAIYRNLQSSTNCSEIIVNANKSCGNSVLRKHNVGDICLVDVKVEDLTLFILGAVYIHPKASAEAVKLCLYQSLLPYSANLTKLIPNFQPDLETSIVLCGDFNCDPQQNSYLVEFMRNEFGLNYVQTSPTTLGNTTIDCTFTRNINVDIMPYVSYFTYHRHMLNKIVVEY
ncbi:uncharacterized protein TNCV_2521271 [Trichonephila clavipes]|nr:uncharacterized protein TNCV_2521271 [Trichonephila clavipes]